MALTLCTIATDPTKPIYFPDGLLAANVPVVFKLVTAGGGSLIVIDLITGNEVVDKLITTQTDAGGHLSVSLWPTERADVPCYWSVQLKNVSFKAPLPDSGTIIWGDFVANRKVGETFDIIVSANAADITAGILDGNRLPSMSTLKKGGVPATGTPTGKVLSDGGTWVDAGTDPTAQVIGSLINSTADKTPPVDADMLGLMDSAETNLLKKLSWANVKATLKTYFDTLYPSGSGNSTGTNTGDQDLTGLVHSNRTDLDSVLGTNTGDQTLPTDATIVTTDVAANNTSITKHGWFPKLPAATGKYLKDDLTWDTPTGGAGAGDVVGPSSAVGDTVVLFDATTGKLIKDSGLFLPVKASGAEITTGTDDAKFATAKALADAGWANLQKMITVNTTITVGASGCDYTTLQAALDYLATYAISPTVFVTININGEVFNSTTNITHTHPDGNRIKIQGVYYTKTLSSIQSSSGSTGNWSIILNLADVTNIATSDYVIIQDPTGGTNPTYLMGCHAVTNVDTGNNRITVNSLSKQTSAPSGSVTTAALVVVKTVLAFITTNGLSGIAISAPFSTLSGIIFKGKDTTNQISSGLFSGTRVSGSVSRCGFVNSQYGAIFENGANVTVSTAGISGNTSALGGIAVKHGSYLYLLFSAVTGNNTGLYAANRGGITLYQATPNGNTTNASPAVDAAVGNNNGSIGNLV